MKTVSSFLVRAVVRAARWSWSSAMVVLVGTPQLGPPAGGGTSSALAEAQLRSGARAQMNQGQTGFL